MGATRGEGRKAFRGAKNKIRSGGGQGVAGKWWVSRRKAFCGSASGISRGDGQRKAGWRTVEGVNVLLVAFTILGFGFLNPVGNWLCFDDSWSKILGFSHTSLAAKSFALGVG